MYMDNQDFLQNFDVPEDLQFYTADILRDGGLRCTAVLDPKYFEDLFTPPAKITRAQVRLEFFPSGKEILVRGAVTGERSVQCARCLNQTTQTYNEEFMESYSAKDEIIDIMLLVRQTLTLTEEIQFLCKPACKGLCSLCGQDLNAGDCGCVPENLSPFAALKGKFK